MPTNRGLCLVAVAFASLGASKSKVPLPPLLVGEDQLVDGQIGGQAVKVRIEPSESDHLYLDPALASKLGLKGGFLVGSVRMGSVKVRTDFDSVIAAIASPPAKMRAFWADRPFFEGVEASTSPSALPHSVITFALRAPQTGETSMTLPMVQSGSRIGSLVTTVIINGQKTDILFDLSRKDVVATAAAAAALSAANGGELSGASRGEVIRLRVERPVRLLKLARPLAFGPFNLTSLWARVSDYSDGNEIKDGDADPSEIVVTAKGAGRSPNFSIRVGRDALTRCSSITFDKPARLIRLQCLA